MSNTLPKQNKLKYINNYRLKLLPDHQNHVGTAANNFI